MRHLFKAGDRWKSLGTKELADAKLKLRVESVRFDAEMAEHRKRLIKPSKASLTRDEIDGIAASYFHTLLAEDEEHRSERLSNREFDRKDETHEIVSPQARRDAARGNVEPYRDEFDDWLVSNGHKLDHDAPVYREVLNRMLREFVRHLDAVAQRQVGDPVDTPPVPTRADTGPTLRELINAYLSDPAASRNSKTLMTYTIVFDALAEIVGEDRPARDITRSDCERVRDVLHPHSPSKSLISLS